MRVALILEAILGIVFKIYPENNSVLATPVMKAITISAESCIVIIIIIIIIIITQILSLTISRKTQTISDPIHYENTPIEIYSKFHYPKLSFQIKILTFFIFLLKT